MDHNSPPTHIDATLMQVSAQAVSAEGSRARKTSETVGFDIVTETFQFAGLTIY